MRTVALSLVVILAGFQPVDAKQIALSFDDAPRKDTALLSGKVRTDALVRSLRLAGVPRAVFFCTTRLAEGKEGISRLMAYADAGHLIANHTRTHPDLHKVTGEAFLTDMRQADQLLRTFRTFRPWFRYPYLHEGDSVDKREFVSSKVQKLGYANGYVTVDTYDWAIDAAVQEAEQKNIKMSWSRIRKTYVDLIMESVRFYDHLASTVLKKPVRHVLLLHENDLAAKFLPNLVAALRTSGWSIIDPELAYQDPIARIEPKTLELGQGRVAALARDRGYTGPIKSRAETEAYVNERLSAALLPNSGGHRN